MDIAKSETKLRAAASLKNISETFEIPVNINGQAVTLYGIITLITDEDNEMTIRTNVYFPPDYVSKFQSSLKQQPFADLMFLPRYQHADVNAYLEVDDSALYRPQFEYLKSVYEDHALSDVLSRAFCFTLQWCLARNLIDRATIVGAESYSEKNGLDATERAHIIYLPMGFTKEKQTSNKNWFLKATVSQILERCSRIDNENNIPRKITYYNRLPPTNTVLTKLTIPVQIDGQTVILEGTIAAIGGSLLDIQLNFPKSYHSALADALDTPLIAVRFTPKYQSFNNYLETESFLHWLSSARQLEQFNGLQTEGEKRGLRGLVGKTFCIALKFAIDRGYLTKESIMGVEASGDSPGNDRSTLADTIYVPLGFVKHTPMGYGDWFLQAPVESILNHCGSKL